MTKNNTLVLAYSGGLDTSFCIPFLKEKGFNIHAITINTGGFTNDDIEQIKHQAYALGASHFEAIDICQQYYDKCIRYLVFGNILRGNTYPLSVSAERAFQALAILEYLKKVDASYVAHGSTGAGNDQIRFDLIFKTMAPNVEIITPIRDHSFSREEEINYLQEKGYDFISADKKDYSINKGIWGTSVGGKETLTSKDPLPDEAYPTKISSLDAQTITLTFKEGEIYALNGKHRNPIELINALEALAGPYGIGRDIHVGDTIIGIKGRVGFEAAAPIIIIKAHELLEKHTLGKWQSYWKKQLAEWYGMQLHEGQYLDPVMRDIERFLEHSQRYVNGEVKITLRPRTFSLDGIVSPDDLMDHNFGKYGEENISWSSDDAKGFIQILSNSKQIYYSKHQNEQI